MFIKVDLKMLISGQSKHDILLDRAPPDANIKNFGSIGNKIQKLVSDVDLMHFGPIDRFRSPKNF